MEGAPKHGLFVRKVYGLSLWIIDSEILCFEHRAGGVGTYRRLIRIRVRPWARARKEGFATAHGATSLFWKGIRSRFHFGMGIRLIFIKNIMHPRI